MTQQRSEAAGFGAGPNKQFFVVCRRATYKKCVTVATVALLAVYRETA